MEALHLRLPATSANLGAGFDALGLAVQLFLEIDAQSAQEFQIEATGRNSDQIASVHGNLLLDTYRSLVKGAPRLRLTISNQIPLGMGLGSSAAAILAGVLLANHFGRLALTAQQVLDEACRREGHPDNVAACFFGGLTASAMDGSEVHAATFPPPRDANGPWRILLALPSASLATSEARALLPPQYSRAEAVGNIQAVALLVSAFALNRPELLLPGSRDSIHQPFRMAACPLLKRLLPLAGTRGVYSVTLSGAGPSILLIADPSSPAETLNAMIRLAAADPALEILESRVLDPREAPASRSY